MTLHFDFLMLLGLCLLPGAFILALIVMAACSSLEIGAIAIGSVVGVITLVAGVALFLVGLGMELR